MLVLGIENRILYQKLMPLMRSCQPLIESTGFSKIGVESLLALIRIATTTHGTMMRRTTRILAHRG